MRRRRGRRRRSKKRRGRILGSHTDIIGSCQQDSSGGLVVGGEGEVGKGGGGRWKPDERRVGKLSKKDSRRCYWQTTG